MSTAPLQAIEQLGSRAEREDCYAFTEGDIRRVIADLRLCRPSSDETPSVYAPSSAVSRDWIRIGAMSRLHGRRDETRGSSQSTAQSRRSRASRIVWSIQIIRHPHLSRYRRTSVRLTSCDDSPSGNLGSYIREIHASINSLLCQQISQD